MAINKLSEQLMDAYMVNDKDRINKIQNEIKQLSANRALKTNNSPILINTVLNNDDASAISVYDFLNKKIGEDWWELEFDAIERYLWIHYGVALEDINRDKVWAIRHLCNSDRAFSDWFEFNQLALSFSGVMADFESIRSPSPGMCISTVKAMNHIRPDRNSEFGPEVLNYICIVMKNNGIETPLPSLALLIHECMSKMVSPGMKQQWIDIIKRYKDIVSNKINDFQENIIDIQAKRLVKAEAAALEYGSR